MYLSHIELLGFKSFPLKTRIDFANGITGVVGPNGCGKTNVLDAIRWVLGEQRTSVLRGGKMEDVIFSGTREMKALGMAEVQLTVVNNCNILPTEYSSVTVTRRLHRSGESEYLLNNVPCRLKDITELFADTGMGANAYSVIELEMVEAILSERADQRRVLFEEAAGITKYKIRKRAALRKLEATEHDLLRLSDILGEVSTQVNSLRRQMRKAERFRSLDERIRNKSLILLKDSCRKTSAELQQVQEGKRVSEIKLAQVAGEIDKWELMREDTRAKTAEVLAQLHEVRTEIEGCSAEFHELNKELSVTDEKIKAAAAANETDLKEIENTRAKREHLILEQQGAQETLERMTSELELCEREAEEKERTLAERFACLEQARQRSQESQRDLFAIEGQKSLSEQSSQQLEEQIEGLAAELTQLESSAAGADAERRHEKEMLAANAGRIDAGRQRLTEMAGELQATEQAVVQTRQSLDSATAALAEARMEAKSIETHVGLQEQMIARYEGYGSGVGAIFAEDAGLSGLIDTVAKLIKPRSDFMIPIELALGSKAEYVLVENRQAADRAIEYLRVNELGTATFLISSAVPPFPECPLPDGLAGVDGYLGRALDLVEVAEEHRAIAGLLLGRVLVAGNREAAEQLREMGCDDFAIVTVDGHFLRSPALLQGGSTGPAQLLGRDIELNALRGKLEAARLSVADSEQKLRVLHERRAQLTAEKKELTSQIEQQNRELSDLKLAATRHELQLKQAEERCRQIEDQIESTRTRRDAVIERREQLRVDSSRLAGDTDGKRAELESQQEKLDEIELEANLAAKEHERLKLKAIKLRTEVESLGRGIERSAELIGELEAAAASKEKARENRQNEIVRLESRTDDLRSRLETVAGKKEQLKAQESNLSVKQAGLSERQSEYEELLKSERKERDMESEKHARLLVRETESKARYEDVRRQLKETFNIEVADLTLPEPLAEEMVSELQQELAELRQSQEQLGMVNMLALEEFDREAQRQEFLQKQIDDLTAAKDNLKATITRINATARKMFLETFAEVRVNFQRVFAELFQGGEADIRLEDDGDPLESPVLISARPRGKRLLNISQLSGGEKALTAISLLFGIYLVKPSPFCVLDEVDAPLDDANVGRFLRIVKAFAEKTQFVIITHNKRTMEQCNRLYGVTMQRPGVSQIVSVDFEKSGRQLDPESMAYLQPEPENHLSGESQTGAAEVVSEDAGDVEDEVPVTAVIHKSGDSE